MKIRHIYPTLSLLWLLSCVPSADSNDGPQNILFIVVDDLRPEFGAYGRAQVISPHLNRLAAEGTVFERAYCNVPVCGSSRASFLSGMRPGRTRFQGAYDTYLSKDLPGAVSLPRFLKNKGYSTHSLGKVYHHLKDDATAWESIWYPEPRNHTGWRDYQTQENIDLHNGDRSRGLPYEQAELPDSAYYDGRIAIRAMDQLEAMKGQTSPFFMAVGFLKPHLPFNAPKMYWDLYDSTQINLPSNYIKPITTPGRAFHNFGELRNYNSIPKEGAVTDEMAKRLIHGYYACVSYTDAQIGKVLGKLEELGLAENTIVVLIGDHGWNLGDHQLWCKHCNFESSLHTPLIVKAPSIRGPKRVADIVEFVDIYPSLVDMVELPVPIALEGQSFVPLMQGKTRSKDYAISKYWSGMTIIQDQWFYTEWIDDSLSIDGRMLFDHSVDSLEINNLAEDPQYAGIVADLHQKLRNNWGEDF
ncbi:MAG: sulfatase [Bacteroidota bacterium]